MYPIEEFTYNLYMHFLGREINTRRCNIIKKHSVNLQKIGEFSFPIDYNVWRNSIKINQSEQIINDEGFQEKIKNIIKESQKWVFPILSIKICKSRCNIYLERQIILKNTLKTLFDNEFTYGVLDQKTKVKIRIIKEPSTSTDVNITEHRLNLIYTIISNLSKYTQFIINDIDNEECDCSIYLGTKSNAKEIKSDFKIICGIAYDPIQGNKKTSTMTSNEYIRKRSIDMQLMAQHKYGLRVKSEPVFVDLVEKLGTSAVTVDLLEVKHTSPVSLSTIISSHKGASFILYNSARLESIIRKFEKKILDEYYPILPEFSCIDFSLLKEEEEWQLVFNFILGFPNIIEVAIGDLNNAKISLHIICIFLQNLVSLFSIYYHRVRILTENRQQLLPIMFARIYLIKALRLILNKVLCLLNIEPITQM